MGIPNFRGAYQLNPEDYDDQYSGGLLGRLQAIMQQGQMQSDADSNSPSSAANSDGGSQDNLLARLAALQGEQTRYRPLAISNAQPSSASRDPNFRQLTRVYINDRTADGIDSDQLSGYLNQGNDNTSQASASTVSAPIPTVKMAQLALPAMIPLSPPVPARAPQIPVLTVPDWWRTAGAMLQLYPRMLTGSDGVDGSRHGLDDTPSAPALPIYMQANPRSRASVTKTPRTTSSIGRPGGDDDENVCDKRKQEENGRCYARWANDEYAHKDWLQACINRATTRWDLCNRNGYRIPRFEPEEWKLNPDEKIWYNERRQGLLRREN